MHFYVQIVVYAQVYACFHCVFAMSREIAVATVSLFCFSGETERESEMKEMEERRNTRKNWDETHNVTWSTDRSAQGKIKGKGLMKENVRS